jgi:hypothetical protein
MENGWRPAECQLYQHDIEYVLIASSTMVYRRTIYVCMREHTRKQTAQNPHERALVLHGHQIHNRDVRRTAPPPN